ncbi:MAG: helix-turn-helix domain-containing protein, partial [Ilumatobacter fluminis]
MRAGSKQLIREINQALVIDAVRRERSVSRTEIASMTGLSAPTISGITNELIERGLLYEAATGESAGGRKPILLRLNAGAGFVLGVKVTEREAIGVLTDLDA